MSPRYSPAQRVKCDTTCGRCPSRFSNSTSSCPLTMKMKRSAGSEKLMRTCPGEREVDIRLI